MVFYKIIMGTFPSHAAVIRASNKDVNSALDTFVKVIRYYEGDYQSDMDDYCDKEVRISDPVPLKSLQGYEKSCPGTEESSLAVVNAGSIKQYQELQHALESYHQYVATNTLFHALRPPPPTHTLACSAGQIKQHTTKK
ncbi:hypothetical protein DPMN_065629 [Dreissena polymorpha]|uniref:Uncharacterized protein n=1 Tax=Dreissena polymorpha TaxID=45954 RepID=A0A9D3YXJ3_DREPO|nr:hypothetical protein DPMN_065629 [Dreissena polymorpha]